MSGPINSLIKRQLQDALAPLERMLMRLVRNLLLGVLILASLFACIVFLSIALYTWLATIAGAAIASLALAGCYLLIALACVLALRPAPERISPQEAGRQADKAEAERAGLADAQQPAAAADGGEEPDARSQTIDQAIAPLIALLQQTGLQRANIIVLLAAALAKQVRPFVLVAIAFVTGFTFGRR